MTEAEKLVHLLRLEPHPEGGYYRETYRSHETVERRHLPVRYGGPRCFSTAIYYLLDTSTFSAMHRIKSDEIFHFYRGGPVRMLLLFPDGSGESVILGPDTGAGMVPQIVVPAGVWQGAMLVPGEDFALLGTTVAPGFDFDDFETGGRGELIKQYPGFSELIIKLTHAE